MAASRLPAVRSILAGLTLLAASPAIAAEETVEQAICRMIEAAAAEQRLPPVFLTRLIWRESSFRPGATSGKGAQGIAQFMPGTAAERGLDDPYDPEAAIPASAHYLADLRDRFGNLGLAAAAYNGGSARLARWLAAGGALPAETEDYVAFVTGSAAEDWRPDRPAPPAFRTAPRDPRPERGPKAERPAPPGDCHTAVAAIRRERPSPIEGPYAPFGVQVAGSFSKARAVAGYRDVAARFERIVAGRAPVVIGTRAPGRGRRPFYRVRIPAATLAAARRLCTDLQRAGGACVVLRN
ncbi:lytic transglycosylase domain-containing protein [Prosthecomicrobium pneumaticum]|uniref:Lytic transglycosylase n=1 Tax=Prosthecomicrobium pneumaticum TaxID=81895 RepID=A0A7W9FPV7_9HYPH|nr:lytic transglycosylase domain-containing protein [Prosthecomicrobium pneumaticum]MBB5754593.1 hypothetical protein [Prosthecomicrobium pneumaticum]